MIERTKFFSSVFFCSEFQSENIYPGVNFLGGKMFAVIFICILREGIWKNRKKIRTRKNFVPHGIQYFL